MVVGAWPGCVLRLCGWISHSCLTDFGLSSDASRMMSDFKVTLVDDSPSDMYIIFHGPKDSAPTSVLTRHHLQPNQAAVGRPVSRRELASARRAPRGLSVQVSVDRFLQPHVPSQRGRNASRTAARRPARAAQPPHTLERPCGVPCRSGAVCLDVINQTWSPMFGPLAPLPRSC